MLSIIIPKEMVFTIISTKILHVSKRDEQQLESHGHFPNTLSFVKELVVGFDRAAMDVEELQQ